MGNTHLSGPLFVAGTQITDASGNITATIEMSDLDQIVDENGNEILEFDFNAAAVNHIVVENSATGVNPKIYTGGEADTGITFENGESEPILVLDAVATSTVYLQVQNATTGVAPNISTEGEADIGMEFHNDQAEQMLILTPVATAVNEITITNAATGANPVISCTGEADTGIDFENSEGEEILILDSVATSVNELTIRSAATGNNPSIAATGDDANIHLDLTPKGTGNIRATLGAFEEPVQALTTDASTVVVYGATTLDSTANKVDCTLGSGTFIGQIKTVVMIEASNSSTLTITNHETSDPEVATFDAVDETGVFLWSGTEWVTLFATCTFV